jgi:hypothetical protein
MYCKKCGESIENEICPNCGTHNALPPTESSTPNPPKNESRRGSENVIYQCILETNDGARKPIVITPQRVTVGNATYSTANITSVSIEEQSPNRFWGILLIIVGAIGLIITFTTDQKEYLTSFSISMGVILLGAIIAYLAKGKAHLAIVTAAGEVRPLWSHDREMIRLLVNHIETAIIERG